MHVVVGNELHTRYDKMELVFPGGDMRTLRKAMGAGVRVTILLRLCTFVCNPLPPPLPLVVAPYYE